MINVAIFASGTGSNALNINTYFKNNSKIRIVGVFCNNAEAGIVKSAPDNGMTVECFNRADLNDGKLLAKLKEQNTEYIILAGFLWLIPQNLLDAFPGKILNIHPALLPLYGGKGMYGMRVHQSVISNGDPQSGITIHEVNAEYDEGQIVFQAKVAIEKDDTANLLAEKIHRLEHQHFPQVIEQWILN
jgi:phosphoribosylglycinamide formyltransferase 1